ncbi:MAG TPA: CDF family Co(II)/Ni(II) efflux transporter DmeF [Stenomitos sp.]
MHIHLLEQWQHPHHFLPDRDRAEKSTQMVLVLTAITMIIEVAAGSLLGSMALLADGWHMATHVGAFGITFFAYRYARHHASNPNYTFGTGKVSILGGFASAVVLGVIAFVMALESITRLFQPHTIQFDEAIGIAILGLAVNIASAFLLTDDHHGHTHSHAHGHEHAHESGHNVATHSHAEHGHHHGHDHGSGRHVHQDHNLRAAYTHVVADALTSVLAIIALVAGKFLGWVWLDAAMGVVGAVVIAKWAYGLIGETGSLLLDGGADKSVRAAIMTAIESDADNRITDLHVWHVSPEHLSATIALVTHYPQPPEYYKQRLSHIAALSHVLVEVNRCEGAPCIPVLETTSLSTVPLP